MSQTYLNKPSMGLSMSAEEYTAGAAGRLPGRSFAQRANGGPNSCQAPNPPDCGCGGADACPEGCGYGCGCGCGGTSPDCPADDCGQGAGCCQKMICTCCPVTPTPQPPQVDECCCCKQSFRAALGLLCNEQISSLLDFDTSAFLTNTYVAGATITPITPPAAGAPVPPADNLGDALTGSFRRFAPCNCDLLDVDADILNAAGTAVALTARQVSLCHLDAVAIQVAAAAAEGDLSADEVTARNFRCVRTRLAQRLNPCGAPCGQESSCTCDCEDCCCAAGLLNTLSQNNLSRRVSLVAGLLALQNVTLLGTVGNVLVLSNDTDNRLYFVCVNSVQFIG